MRTENEGFFTEGNTNCPYVQASCRGSLFASSVKSFAHNWIKSKCLALSLKPLNSDEQVSLPLFS